MSISKQNSCGAIQPRKTGRLPFLPSISFAAQDALPGRKNDLDTVSLKNKTRKKKRTEPRKITLSYKSTQPYEKNRRSAPTMFCRRIRRSAIFGNAIYEVRQFPPLLLWKAIGGKHNGYGENYLLKKKRVFRFSSNFGFRVHCLCGKIIDPRNNRPGYTGGEIIDLGGEIISARGIFPNIRWRRNNRAGSTWISLPTCPTIPSHSSSNLHAAYQHPQ